MLLLFRAEVPSTAVKEAVLLDWVPLSYLYRSLPSGVAIVRLYPALQSDCTLMDSLWIDVPSPVEIASREIELLVVIEAE